MNGNLTFGYDAFNRLTSMSGSKGDTYGYDRYGNRWNKGTGPSLTFGADNRIVSASSFAYDAAGNVLWDGFYSYCYDAENRLLRAVAGRRTRATQVSLQSACTATIRAGCG